MKNKIIVIGSANADMVIHTERMPLLGETLMGSNFQINTGGKGLNQAVAIAKLGGDVSFLGSIGTDPNGELLLKELEKNGILFQGIQVSDCPTGIAMITVVGGDNFIVLESGANAKLTPEWISEHKEIIENSDYCVMQLEIPLKTIEKICEIALAANTKIILNPAPYKELPKTVLSCVDYLVPNEHETFNLTNVYPDTPENCKKAIKVLKGSGVKNVVITLGERGCVYDTGNDIVFCSAKPTSVVDTTSAGDCFIGAFVAKLSKGDTIENSIAFAIKAAAITVSREGASKSIPFASEIE